MGKNAPEGRNSVRKSLEAETVWWEENHLEGEQETRSERLGVKAGIQIM